VGRFSKLSVALTSAVLLGLFGCGESDHGNTVEGSVTMRVAGSTDPFGVRTGPDESTVPDAGAGVHLLRGDKVVMSTSVTGGRFTFRGVEPGPYRVYATLLNTPSDTTAMFDAVPGRVEVPGMITLADTGLIVGNNPVGPVSGWASLFMTFSQTRVVNLRVYNATGNLVRTLVSRQFPAGVHALQWDCTSNEGARLAPGRYTAILLKDSLAAGPGFGLRPVGRYDIGPGPINASEPLTWGRAHIIIH
jgi:hypothetical protein